jgi:site-specific DNA-methyltransferase (adenine-specific)
VTWDKYNGNPTKQCGGGPMVGMTQISSLRKYQDFAEYIVYHADDGQWTAQGGECRGFIFEPLRAYLEGEMRRAGWNKARLKSQWMTEHNNKSEMPRHWFEVNQWELPTSDNYEWLRRLFNAQGGDYLRREYDYLRAEYEHLRPTFNNPGKVSSVWQYPPAPASGHATPKPVELMQRIIETTTNPGDTVLDCFMGAGTTGLACIKTGRRFIGMEKGEREFDLARQRLDNELRQELLLLTHNDKGEAACSRSPLTAG